MTFEEPLPQEHEDFENESDEEIRAAWKEEILRRLEDIKSGTAKVIPVEETFRRFHEKYG